MIASAGMRKMLAFGLLGAVGCLVAWGLGEGLLAASQAVVSAEELAAASLVQPGVPEAPPPAAVAPPEPGVPGAVPPPPPPPPAPKEMAKRLEEAKAGTGDIQISLKWDNRNDLDLHCVEPNGDRVWYDRKKTPSGGWLDVDRNAGGIKNLTTTPIENIFWAKNTAPKGEYKVYLRYLWRNLISTNATDYEVRTQVGHVARIYKGQIEYGQPERLIATFQWPPPDLRLAVPDQVIVHQGGKNQIGIKVARENLKGPVKLNFTCASKDVTLDATLLEEGSNEVKIDVVAAKDAKPGRYLAKVEGAGGGENAEGTFEVRVRPIPATLALAAPPEVEVYPGQENKFTVRIRRNHFAGPVNLRFGGASEGLTFDGLTIPSDRDEVTVTVAAGKSAAGGGREVEVQASGESAEAGATAKVIVRVKEAAVTRKSGWSWLALLRTAAWTALLAVGLALALVLGQNYFLSRPLFTLSQVKVLGGALLAGAIAGGVAQTLANVLAVAGGLGEKDGAQAQTLLPLLGFVIGWTLLGGLLGRGIAFFIPNLDGWKACAAGVVAGLLGSLVFATMSRMGSDVVGRLLGAILLGFAIGLMVALVEQLFRKVWLEVRSDMRETVTVNLGPEPVKVGSDASSCAVFARGAAPVALRFWLREGKVFYEDVPNRRQEEAPLDRVFIVASVSLVVRSAMVTASAATAAPPKQPAAPPRPTAPPRPAAIQQTAPPAPAPRPAVPPPVAAPRPPQPAPRVAPVSQPPVPAPAPRMATPPKPAPVPHPAGKRGDTCPECGAFVPFKPGERECICGHRL